MSIAPSPALLCLGEPLGEFNQTRPGEPNFLFGHGGDMANVAVAAARSGAAAGVIGAIGDDMAGRSFLDLWAREGVDARGVKRDPAHPTGLYFVTHGAAGHEFSYLRAGSAAARMGPDDLPAGLIAGAKALHLSAISQAISASACDACFAAVDQARAAGVTVSYDTNLRLKLWPLARARAVIEATLALTDIALPGLDDARQITGISDPDAIADHMLRRGARIVAMTLGKDGALVATPDARRRIPSIAVQAVDATAAGDCFDGAFLAEWLRGGDPFESARYACAAAALSTTGYGAVAPMPRRAAVQAALAGRG